MAAAAAPRAARLAPLCGARRGSSRREGGGAGRRRGPPRRARAGPPPRALDGALDGGSRVGPDEGDEAAAAGVQQFVKQDQTPRDARVEAYYTAAQRLIPDSALVLSNWASYLMEAADRKDAHRALTLFERAMECDPDDVLTMSKLAGCYEACGMLSTAREMHEAAVQAEPTSDFVLAAHARFLWQHHALDDELRARKAADDEARAAALAAAAAAAPPTAQQQFVPLECEGPDASGTGCVVATPAPTASEAATESSSANADAMRALAAQVMAEADSLARHAEARAAETTTERTTNDHGEGPPSCGAC